MSGSKDILITFKHALIYSGSGMLGKAIGFIMLPVYAHYLRGEGYGIIGMIDVVLSVVTLLIGYGIQGAMMRFYYDRNTEKARKELVSTGIIVMFFLVVVVSLPVLLLNKQVASLAFGIKGFEHYITLALLTFIASMTSKSAETYILIKQQSVFYSALSIMRLTFGLSFNIYFIVHLKLGVLGYLYSGLVVATIFSLIIHGWTLFHVGLHFNKNDALDIIKLSLPLLPGYVAMFVRGNAARVILRSMLGLTMLGAFEMLFKFATLIGFLIVEPFSKIWVVKRYEIADTKGGPQTIAKVFTLQLALLFFLGLILSLEIPIILKILTPREFWLGGSVVFLAILSRIILSCYYHFFFGLLYAKKTYKISIIQISSAAVSMPIYVLLIYPFGILGAVIASCLVNTFQCIMAFRMSKVYYHIPFEWTRVVQITCFAVFCFFAIDWISIAKVEGLANWINSSVAPFVANFMEIIHLDRIKDGKLLSHVIDNIPALIDGVIKLILSFLFIGCLLFVNIIPREKIFAICRKRSLSPLVAR